MKIIHYLLAISLPLGSLATPTPATDLDLEHEPQDENTSDLGLEADDVPLLERQTLQPRECIAIAEAKQWEFPCVEKSNSHGSFGRGDTMRLVCKQSVADTTWYRCASGIWVRNLERCQRKRIPGRPPPFPRTRPVPGLPRCWD